MKKNESIWAKGSFAQSMSKEEIEEKEKTIHMKHDEEMNFNCKKCNKKISAHNKEWHDEMCDDCFDKTYFPEDYKEYKKRLIILKNGKEIDPIMMRQEDFEKELGLTQYIETKEGKEDKLYVDAFFLFLEKANKKNIIVFRTYEEEITNILKLSFEEIKQNLYLEYQDKGKFYDEDICSSQAFTDKESFYVIVQKGIIFFSGTKESAKIMQEALKELKLDFHLEELKE
jgi:hypothetical protein